MLFSGCQGNKGPQIQEMRCQNCGNPVEILSTEISAKCEECGTIVYSDLMACAQHCTHARECLGEQRYADMLASREAWRSRQLQAEEDDW